MNKITIGNFTFTDNELASNPELFLSESMLADSLGIDTIEFDVYSDADGTERNIITADDEVYATSSDEPYVVYDGDLMTLPYGEIVQVYKDDVLRERLYLEKIERKSIQKYHISAYSAIGLLDKQTYLGGMYNGTYIQNIIFDIAPLMFTVDQSVNYTKIYGWLPRGSARDCLRDLLFSVGASIVKKQGWLLPRIVFNSGTINEGDADTIYLDDAYPTAPEKVTKVVVTEHSFVAGDNPEEVLFDNTGDSTVTNEILYFDFPYHSFRGDGITIVESDVNWAKVSGLGVLYGKKYTDTQRQLSQDINAGAEPNEVVVDKAYLINSLNSTALLNRMVNYYSNAEIVEFKSPSGITTRPGAKVNFTDPITKEQKSGLIQSDAITLSAIDKHSLSVVSNWTPRYFGNTYTHSHMITRNTSASWTAPEGVEQVRLILIGGGQGGYSGANGEAGNQEFYNWTVEGGKGGAGGQGGSGGKVLIVDMQVPIMRTLVANVGKGGAGAQGGSDESVAGALGTDTSVQWYNQRYSSANGSVLPAGFTDTFTGRPFAFSGKSGIAGSDGTSYYPSIPQTSVTYNGETWMSGGIGGDTWDNSPAGRLTASGGMGGGSAVGANGLDGEDGDWDYQTVEEASTGHLMYYLQGGNGGKGADALINGEDRDFFYGSGGQGGHGGGGGGGGGYGSSNGTYQGRQRLAGWGGDGGHGSNGGKGADGVVIIYF